MPAPIHCVLLIDDDSDDNFLHQLVIAKSGLCNQVRVTENGPYILPYITNSNQPDYLWPDIILLDIKMPGMNGVEFLEAYHYLPAEVKSRVMVVMLTISLTIHDQQRVSHLAEVIYQPKPLTINDCVLRVGTLAGHLPAQATHDGHVAGHCRPVFFVVGPAPTPV
ncbi:MAG: response regulator [Bacteroidetes bacterium]|nr:response regulator [Fibrella sp.]